MDMHTETYPAVIVRIGEAPFAERALREAGFDIVASNYCDSSTRWGIALGDHKFGPASDKEHERAVEVLFESGADEVEFDTIEVEV